MKRKIDELKKELSELLEKWAASQVSKNQVHEEAEDILYQLEWENLPKENPSSVVLEVLSLLDIMNHQLIIPEDIPAILSFINSSSGTELSAWETWESYWNAIDFNERLQRLKGDPFYSSSS